MADYIRFYRIAHYVGNREEGHLLNEKGFVGIIEHAQQASAIEIINSGWQPSEIRDKRVWLLFSHYQFKTRDFVLARFNELGRIIDARRWNGTEIYLYQIN